MTVGELIKQLEDLDQTKEVYFAHPSHDYWRSELASEVESVGEELIKHSQYHGQMTTVRELDGDNADMAVVIR